jgi:acyl-CoA synthetase (AMP-forming)/AMP-acid ligase II
MSFFGELEQYENNVAYVIDQNKFTNFSQVINEADLFSSDLKPRQIVLCIASNTSEFFTAYLGFMRRGVVPLLLPSSCTYEDILSLINVYKPTYLFLPFHKYLKPDDYRILSNFGSYQLLINDKNDSLLDPNLAILLTTSGTTGSSKLVMISHDNLNSNCESIVEYMKLGQSSRAITSLPFSYSYGLSIINTHLFVGGSVILTENAITQSQFWDSFDSYAATHLGGVPFSYEVYKRYEKRLFASNSLEILTQAGGKLPKNLVSYFAEKCRANSIRFFVMYGQTEATARISYMNCEDAIRKPDSVGKAIPGGEIILVDSKDQPIAQPGVEGELVYKGPNVSMGYANTSLDLYPKNKYSDTLRTGDLAFRDHEGDIFIVGRLSRNAKINGIRINLQEIDDHLTNEETVSATVSDDLNICTFYTGQADHSNLIFNIQRISKVRVNQIQLRNVEQLPRTAAGKIDYKEVKTWI